MIPTRYSWQAADYSSLSQEEIDNKLSEAEERRKKAETEKAEKAAKEVERAKQVAEETRRLSDNKSKELAAELQKKLDDAEQKREEIYKERVKKTEDEKK
ncbi:8819_t:CDS:2 [Entrophospora sp. SA101]|nr:8819_t:CDS:2 [Entrophospora sp. SA101]